jgi:hypothetical protein
MQRVYVKVVILISMLVSLVFTDGAKNVGPSTVGLKTPQLEKNIPYVLKNFKNANRWALLEKDTRVVKGGTWSKKKSGKKRRRKFHYNAKKLYPVMREYRLSVRREGFTVDITNSFLNFYKYNTQHKHTKRQARVLAESFLFQVMSSLSIVEDATRPTKLALDGANYPRWTVTTGVFQPFIKRFFKNVRRVPLILYKRFKAYIHQKYRSLAALVFWRVRHGAMNLSLLRRYRYRRKVSVRRVGGGRLSSLTYYTQVKRTFRHLTRYARYAFRRLPSFEYLFDPVFIPRVKKKYKNRFFLFTMFKSKK